MTDPAELVASRFTETFGGAPMLLAEAPGRVNLIGEHTDYNDGFVLPCAIDYKTSVAASPRNDDQVHVVAVDINNEDDAFPLSNIAFNSQKMWSNYVRGVFHILQAEGFRTQGVNLVISGNVPQGAGLSSSASLETALLECLRALFGIDISNSQMALLGQKVENEFVGVNCGVMDQMISANGAIGHAMLLDCRSLNLELVSIPTATQIVIINSNKERGLVDSAYNERRSQCEMAANILGVNALRDATLETLDHNRANLDETTFRRARHVISENERTVEAAKALANGDLSNLSGLMAASHASMRDDFEITVSEIDHLVEIVANVIGNQGGVRMTGGGFGGCVVALVPDDLVSTVTTTVQENYYAETGLRESIFICSASAGAQHRFL